MRELENVNGIEYIYGTMGKNQTKMLPSSHIHILDVDPCCRVFSSLRVRSSRHEPKSDWIGMRVLFVLRTRTRITSLFGFK